MTFQLKLPLIKKRTELEQTISDFKQVSNTSQNVESIQEAIRNQNQRKAAAFMVQQKQKQEIQNQGSSRTTDRTKSIENSLVGEASDKPEKSNYVIKEQQKFQPQIDMRKGFAGRYDKRVNGSIIYHHYQVFKRERINNQNNQSNSLQNLLINTQAETEAKIKILFLAIKALVRWAKLVKYFILIFQDLQFRKRLNSFYSNCFKEVIYNDQIKAIKFKQWTQMVFSKVFNQIKKERLEQYQNLNIIDGPYQQLSPKEHDICVLKLRYFIQLMLEGFWQ